MFNTYVYLVFNDKGEHVCTCSTAMRAAKWAAYYNGYFYETLRLGSY
jgi:hypothetical protein